MGWGLGGGGGSGMVFLRLKCAVLMGVVKLFASLHVCVVWIFWGKEKKFFFLGGEGVGEAHR